MAFEVQYNGMRFLGVLTTAFDQEPVRDDSNTDTWYDKFTISVETVANVAVFTAANQLHGIVGNRVQGASAAEVCRNIQSRLEDRKPFKYIQDGTTLVESDINSDANNGPRVLRKSVKPMGANSFRVQVTFEVSKVVCTENPTPVIGNRWQVVDEIDWQFRTTRAWRGKLRLCNAVHNPQAFRGMVLPLLSDGFKRVRMHFTGELNALELSYEIVDQQMLGDAPPAPALTMSGTHTETMDRNGAFSIGEVHVRLDGRPATDKQVLLEACMRVINSKVQADRFRGNENWIWQELIVIDHFGQDVNAVEARARVQRSIRPDDQGNEALKLGSMILETFARPMDLGGNYNRFRIVPPEAYPCTTIGLFKSYLQSPCVDEHRMPQAADTIDAGGSVDYQVAEQTEATYDPQGTPVEIDSPGYSPDHTEAMYTFCRIESIYDLSSNYVQLPYGAELPGSASTAAHIRLAGATGKRIIKFSAERVGAVPRIWNPVKFTDASGIVHYPLKAIPNIRPPEYQGDGRQLFVVDAHYEFGLNRVPSPSEYRAPSLPWDDTESNWVSSDLFGPPEGEKGL